MKSPGTGLLFVGSFLITVSISVLVIRLFLFSIPGSVSECCTFLRICPFLLGYPFYWHIVLILVSYDPLYFCGVHCNFFFICKCVILFLAALGLHCCMRAFTSCSKWGLLFFVVSGLLLVVDSLVVEHRL